MLTFAREVAGSLSLRYVLRGVCTHASAVAGGARVVVWVLDGDRRVLDPIADSAAPGLEALGLEPVEVGDGLVGRAGQFGRLTRPDEGEGSPAGELAVPMVVGAQVIGVLQFTGTAVAALSGSALGLVETMAIHAATALDAARLHERTSDMAMTDVLTGLPNRRRLDADLHVECAASARYGRPLSLLMIDVDHFKPYNDEFGHQAGDVALQAVAGILGRDLRPTDRAYRYGGEEFVIVLRETDLEAAARTAERVRAAVEHHFASPLERRPVTISIGIAGVPGHEPVPHELLTAADAALYESKTAGRNRVTTAPATGGVRPA